MKKKIVVIGSGLAGSLLSNELVRRFDVTLLEKGERSRVTFPDIRFLKKKFAEVKTCCFGGGGTTNLWHNGLIPISPEDINSPEFRTILGEASAYMDRTATALFYRGSSYVDDHRKFKEETAELAAALTPAADDIDCLVYPKSYRKLSAAPGVQAVYSVKDISFSYEDGGIRSLSYTTGTQRCQLEPDVVVLAAGALGTPGLVDNVMTAAGFRNGQAGVGFIDHPMGFVGKVKFSKDLASAVKVFALRDQGEHVCRSALRLKSPCGNYTACVFFRPAVTMDNRLSIYKYKSSLGASNGTARLKNMFSWKLFHPDVVAEIIAHLFGVAPPGRTYSVLLIAEQKRGGNSVRERDGVLQVDWEVTDEELNIYRAMLIALRERLAPLADELSIQTELSQDWLWSAAHHSGTLSLGMNETDLLDLDLKLKCCDNVYVCDGSVIQEHSYANTGLAIGQLALRLADRIAHVC